MNFMKKKKVAFLVGDESIVFYGEKICEYKRLRDIVKI